MTWKLFIDDERHPKTVEWVIARTSADAIHQVRTRGMPTEIAFDHDLGRDTYGQDDTTMKFLNWMTDQFLDGTLSFPEGFKYSVHSMNPVGARMIANRMNALLDHFRKK